MKMRHKLLARKSGIAAKESGNIVLDGRFRNFHGGMSIFGGADGGADSLERDGGEPIRQPPLTPPDPP